MVYSKQLKEEVLERLKNEPVSKLSLEYGISNSTLYKWKKEIKVESKEIQVNTSEIKKNITKLQSEVKKLVKDGELVEALKLIDSCDMVSKQLDIQKASILYRMGTLKSLVDAKELYGKYLDDNYVLPLYNKVVSAIKVRKNGKSLNFHKKRSIPKNKLNIKDNENEKLIAKSLLTKLYCDSITLDEINNSDISDYNKTVLTIAYYEKYNKKTGLSYIKKKKNEYSDDKEKIKVINFLTERLKISKKSFFDVSLYSKYIGCYIDSEEAIRILETSKQNALEPKINTNVNGKTKNNCQLPSAKKEKKQSTIISRECTRVSSRYSNVQNINVTTNNIVDKEVLIKDVFSDEVFEIGKHLYVRMRNLETRDIAIAAWDNLEVLINKPITDKYALGRIIYIIKRIEKLSLLDIQYNENKIKKHLNKTL